MMRARPEPGSPVAAATAAAALLAALGAWLASAPAASARPAGPATVDRTTVPAERTSGAAAGPTDPDLRTTAVRVDTVEAGGVMQGDLIRLTIWGEEDLSGELPVSDEGVVVLPKVGRRQVAGMTPREVEEMVLEELGAYLRTPSIEVTVLRTVKVLGAVTKPGLYNVDPSRSVRDAVAVAGGVSPVGNPDDIRVVRNGQLLAEDLRLQARLLDTPVRSGDEIYVPERSWFARNTGAVISGAVGLLSVIAAIVVR